MSAGDDYFAVAQAHLEKVRASQGPALDRAAEAIAGAVAGGGTLWTTGCGHSALLAQEVFYRAGGFLLVNFLPIPGTLLHERPVPMTSKLEKLPGLGAVAVNESPLSAGDAIIVISTSGLNAVPVDVALAAKAKGAVVIALTSSAYAGEASRHPSGKTLAQAADVVIDTLVPKGDAALQVAGVPTTTGPLSGAVGTVLMQALIAGVLERLAARGMEPPVFRTGNLPGGPEHNERLLGEYADRVHYL